MMKEFAARRLDVKAFAEEGGQLVGEEAVGQHPRLLAETAGRGADLPVAWSARGEMRDPEHVQPGVWLHLQARTVLPLTCQRCLEVVDVAVSTDRSFRFVADEKVAAAHDDQSEEDLLALSRSFDLVELVEDELLMEMPVVPRHGVCPEPVKMATADAGFEEAATQQPSPFSVLQKLKTGKR